MNREEGFSSFVHAEPYMFRIFQVLRQENAQVLVFRDHWDGGTIIRGVEFANALTLPKIWLVIDRTASPPPVDSSLSRRAAKGPFYDIPPPFFRESEVGEGDARNSEGKGFLAFVWLR
jgi:hypothetical protein